MKSLRWTLPCLLLALAAAPAGLLAQDAARDLPKKEISETTSEGFAELRTLTEAVATLSQRGLTEGLTVAPTSPLPAPTPDEFGRLTGAFENGSWLSSKKSRYVMTGRRFLL